ncbi:pap 25a associated domain-containingfamily [Trichoderma cornu-damae]|uniref:polynucleotide adenylyltransferase n=1 Tax=Trichoderma cornu-damae TaxID=654480 RepID=A0A9P8TTF9_9HYPO|nr:pap 25a associated domain-containingfamily [Trichoderma cornu-damae]
MDTRTQASEAQHSYSPGPWASTTPTTPNGLPAHTPDGSQDAASAAAASGLQFAPRIDFLPFLFPQQSIYHAQLLHYNKLISPARGGGLQSAPLPPVVSAPHVQAAPRSRSSSKASLRDSASTAKGNTTGGHGSRAHQGPDKSRTVTTSKEVPPKMPAKLAADLAKNFPHRAIARSSSPHGLSHSSSVPSTPHQHARQFSFESREPSPNAGNNHSPRSAYSETNSTLPSLRPLPPRLGGCKYETAQVNSRRRIPYSVGNERLEQLDLQNVKGMLSEMEEKKLAADMSEIYNKLLPTDKVEENRRKLVNKLEAIFNEEWPGHEIKVHLFGSSGNLLCSDDSDVDICITTPWHEMEDVCMIADLLARRGMEKVVCISAAKVPIVKMWDPELGLACDMNVNNTLALENTRMVRTYVEADPRVRQLAMVLKHWTRRRIVNDAAFGGTLSSYTWICLIIAFLQLRNPAVLPALHQLPHKTTKPDGTVSDFADNLKKIKGFGNKNKSTEAELLFQFFRFYAHEFDYDKHVLSVRQGKLITKQEKKWHYAMNNQLCVEEPFNTNRNLGNTADEYSFRGLHLELRRAFDLISAAKLEEACEQYVYPKEEERVWSRPASQPRPVLLRSSSQTHSSARGGRGGHRGGRHSNNYHRSGGSNRRPSSTTPTYDPAMFVQPVSMPQDISWFAAGNQYPFPFAQQDLMQMAYQESMRQQLHHLYAQQSPAFMAHQAMGQQRMPPNAGSSGPQSTADRSRTNSFDTAPIGATLRPDLYTLYGMGLNQQFYAQAATGYGTYPSSPVTANGMGQDFRRPLQRSTVTSDNGISASSSSLRSQSQPASRSPSTAHSRAAYTHGAGPSSAPGFAQRHMHGAAIPSFISDDADSDDRSKATSNSPQSEEGRPNRLLGTRGSSPGQQPLPQSHNPTANGIAFGDVANQSSSPRRRRLSTDQLPQTILDRRMRRASRSPSPLDHSRAMAAGATSSSPLASAQFAGVGQAQNRNPTRPLVVNGSGLKNSIIAASNQGQKASPAPEESATARIDNALHVNAAAPSANGTDATDASSGQPSLASAPSLPTVVTGRPPVIVNGSNAKLAAPLSEDASFRDRIAMMNSHQANSHGTLQDILQASGMTRLPASTKQRLMSRQAQNGVIAPLDLAMADQRKSMIAEMAHLSPVYEMQTSSPTALRKPDVSAAVAGRSAHEKTDGKAAREETAKPAIKAEGKLQSAQEGQKPSKAQKPASQNQRNNTPRENGHVRSAKSESDGGWQKAGKGKKKGSSGLAQATHAEQLPKSDSERKGG